MRGDCDRCGRDRAIQARGLCNTCYREAGKAGTLPPKKAVDPLTEEQQRLAESCVKFAYQLIREYSRKAPWFADEIESAGLYGLVRGAVAFDPARGKFITCASWYVRGTILDFLGSPHARRAASGSEADAHALAFAPGREMSPPDDAAYRELLAGAAAMAAPCLKCGTTGGAAGAGGGRPKRARGLCGTCYGVRRTARKRRAARLAREKYRELNPVGPCPRCGRDDGPKRVKKMCPTCYQAAYREKHKAPPKKASPVPPCVTCGTLGGYAGPKAARPGRYKGGKCWNCYLKAHRRARAADMPEGRIP